MDGNGTKWVGQKGKHVWNEINSMYKCLSLSLSWQNDNKRTRPERNGSDKSKNMYGME